MQTNAVFIIGAAASAVLLEERACRTLAGPLAHGVHLLLASW